MDRRLVLAAAVVALAAAAAVLALGRGGGGGGECNLTSPYFVIYGQDWCPHCQAEMRFLNETFGPDSYEFRDLDVPEYDAAFRRAVWDLASRGVPVSGGFPLTGIYVDCQLVAIVEGEISSQDYLNAILDAAEPGKILVVVGGNGYLVEPNDVLLEVFAPAAG